MKIYHRSIINKILRSYIIEHSINRLNRQKLSVIDLAGGRGADELALFHAGCSNIFAVDADRDALVQYANRTPTLKLGKWNPILHTSRDLADKSSVLLNVVHAYLSDNNDECIREIKSRYEYPKGGFDVILMNYAIHYLCYKHDCIKALSELVNELLKPGGLFIFTCFDGDMILNDTNNGYLKLNSFEINVIDSESGSDEDAVRARMPLPTIDSSGYRAEPLVLKSWLNDLKLQTVDHYYPLDKCKLIDAIASVNTLSSWNM